MSAPEARRETSGRALLFVFAAILVLGALSLVLRFAHIGSLTFLSGMGIAAVQAMLVAVFFMELAHERATIRFAFTTCLSLFALLMVLVIADLLTRPVPPLGSPPGTSARYHG